MLQVLVIKSLLFLTGSLIKMTNAITKIMQIEKKKNNKNQLQFTAQVN